MLIPRADSPDQIRIGHELRIGRVQGYGLGHRLGDEKAVEGIAVQEWQPRDESGRADADRQFAGTRAECCLGNLARVEGKLVPTEARP